jgi:hypothetical protein
MGFQMTLLLTIGLSERFCWGRKAFCEDCSGEKRHSGQIRKPLFLTTIQEMGLLGKRISLRKTWLFPELRNRFGLSRSGAVVIFVAVLCNARA